MLERRSVLVGAMGLGLVESAEAAELPCAAGYKRIAVEEAFASADVDAAMAELRRDTGGSALPNNPAVRARQRAIARDLGEERIRGMDEAGIDVQILSLGAPGVQSLETARAIDLARRSNDYLAEAVQRFPGRYAGLCSLAPQDPESAAREFERSIQTLGFKGAMINSHTLGEYLDLPKFEPILNVATALDVPIYIHPRDPVPGMAGPLDIPGFHVGWAYAVEVGAHVLRMMSTGVFDRMPNLQIVIGHMGEMLPFYLDRLDNRLVFEFELAGRQSPLRQAPSEYFQTNITVTTSGVNYELPLKYTIDKLGAERVMFAADYPFEDQEVAVQNVERARLSSSVKRQIFQRTAERVFKL